MYSQFHESQCKTDLRMKYDVCVFTLSPYNHDLSYSFCYIIVPFKVVRTIILYITLSGSKTIVFEIKYLTFEHGL